MEKSEIACVCGSTKITKSFIESGKWLGSASSIMRKYSLTDERFKTNEYSLGFDFYAKVDLLKTYCEHCGNSDFIFYKKEVLQNQPETGCPFDEPNAFNPTKTEPVNDDNAGDGERDSKIHIVKCWIQFKDDIISGKKKFEVRVNDRDYRVGDILIQQFWDNDLKRYVGGQVEQKIDYVLSGGQFGIEPNTVVMSVSSISEPDLLGKLKESEEFIEFTMLNCTPDDSSMFETFFNSGYNLLETLKKH